MFYASWFCKLKFANFRYTKYDKPGGFRKIYDFAIRGCEKLQAIVDRFLSYILI